MTGWLIDINPRECPPDVMEAPEAYRAAWGRYVGEAVPGDGDPEDWREQAARLEAATRILPDPHVRVAGRSYGGPDPMTLAHYGVVRIRPYMDQLTLPASNVDRWDLIPALRPFLGRDVQSVPCDGDAIDAAARGMLDRHPGAGVVAKFMLREKRLPLAFIDPDGTFEQSDEYGGKPERIPFAAWRWAGYDLALFEGEPDAVLVQQKARMRYEYRVQVIGGEPVCGAGCIERFTPADNRGDRYDPRMEETRNSGRIESHPDIARLYEAFALEAAHAIRGEVEGPYVMDLYLDDAGRPHVIELNPQSNSGLYALDMDALLTAIRDNPEQFMPETRRGAACPAAWASGRRPVSDGPAPMIFYVYRKNVYRGENMRLLSYAISGLRLYENHECRMDLYAIDAVREPGYTHMLDGAARNISVNTVIGIAGINASGKTTALRVTELALAVAGGMSLGSLNPDLFPLYDTMDDRIGVRALFEQDGRFHFIDSLLERTGEGRTPLRFIRETLSIHHGKLSKKMLASAMNGTLDSERWTVLSSRNVGRPGVRGELSADAKRYLPPDRSICGAFVKDTDIATELLPVSPTLTVSPARPVVTLFDASIERLDYDKDGIHLKFRNEGKEREVTPNSLVNMVSSGTLRGGALVGRALETLRAGGYLIVDELENSINKQLVFTIMDLFASPVTNPHGATLLFSTHYPELLDHFTRKDSIWFAVRDGKGFALRNLGAYLGRTDLKKSVSFFANRVPGTAPSYAAVRALQDYAERHVHA